VVCGKLGDPTPVQCFASFLSNACCTSSRLAVLGLIESQINRRSFASDAATLGSFSLFIAVFLINLSHPANAASRRAD